MKATWNDEVIADSDETVVLEGNHYFPVHSVNKALLVESDSTSECSCKGTAHSYSIQVIHKINTDAAWYYAQPKPEAAKIRSHIALWKGVKIEE